MHLASIFFHSLFSFSLLLFPVCNVFTACRFCTFFQFSSQIFNFINFVQKRLNQNQGTLRLGGNCAPSLFTCFGFINLICQVASVSVRYLTSVSSNRVTWQNMLIQLPALSLLIWVCRRSLLEWLVYLLIHPHM